MKKIIISFVVFFFSSYSVADWKVTSKVDSMTDQIKKTAEVNNPLGHKFSIYRLSKGGKVWANFKLSNDVFDQVDWERPPIFRVDKNEPTNLQSKVKLQKMGFNAYDWSPKWVNFLIWHGKSEEGISVDLGLIMKGDTILFRYYLSTGGFKETTFSLNGASAAISEAIDIEPNLLSSAPLQMTKEFKEAYVAEIKKCTKTKNFVGCATPVKECKSKFENNVDKFLLCTKEL
ncbi:hypothetical protein [Psychromonas aquatilis]|uniref:Uncharacterized protein n=1 Tax=Psychromonas aquatilis TaxID=2005072 RepID=A0ABU9GTS5_9GAMM